MKPEQDKNAFAYVIYERSTNSEEWIRSLMFYADDPAFSTRDAAWEHNIGWRDPDKIRVRPLYDEDGNDARRNDNLELINAQYETEVYLAETNVSLTDAVETALGNTNIEIDQFAALLKTLQAFESQVQHQLEIPPNTVVRAEYLPSVEQLEALGEFPNG